MNLANYSLLAFPSYDLSGSGNHVDVKRDWSPFDVERKLNAITIQSIQNEADVVELLSIVAELEDDWMQSKALLRLASDIFNSEALWAMTDIFCGQIVGLSARMLKAGAQIEQFCI